MNAGAAQPSPIVAWVHADNTHGATICKQDTYNQCLNVTMPHT